MHAAPGAAVMTGPALLPPGLNYWLGTDALGHSVAWLLTEATIRTCVTVGIAVMLASAIGLIIGLVAGFLRVPGMRFLATTFVTLSYSTPLLVVLLLVYTFVGNQWLVFPVVAGCFVWGGIALAVQTEAEQILRQPYILAARSLGASRLQVLRRHALPNLLPAIWAATVGTVAPLFQVLILVSFLGIGADSVTLGSLIREGYDLFPAGWWLWLPAALIACLILASTAAATTSDAPRSSVPAHRT